MFFEIVFFIAAIAVVVHFLRQVVHGRPAKVGTKQTSIQLNELAEYADQLYHEKKFMSAEKAYLKILKMDHKHVVSYRRLGLIYSAQKNYDEAIESFQIAVHLEPTTLNYFNLGVAFYENSNYIKALAMLEKGLIFGASADVYHAIGKTQLKMNHLGKAVEAFEKAAASKATKIFLTHLAEAYQLAGRKEDAAKTYAKVLKIDPNDPKAKRHAEKPVSA